MNQLKLLLYLLITETLSKVDGDIKKKYYWTVDENNKTLNRTWKETFEWCRSEDKEMLTLTTVVKSSVTKIIPNDLRVVWMALVRDSKNDSAWHWINTQSGAADSEDLSRSCNWADEAQSSHCAFLNSESTWYSKRCEEKYYFFCSTETDDVIHMRTKLSWHDARKSCQKNSSDLATITENTTGTSHKSGWIGLYRVGGETWQWAAGQSLGYTAWQRGQPVTYDCGAVDTDAEKWKSYPCDTPLNFMCYDDNLVVVHENKTWEQALEHCMKLDRWCPDQTCVIQHKLLTLASNSDYSYVRERISGATTHEVWTGLRFLGGEWWWVNGDQVSDEGKLPQCPLQPNHCGVISKTDDTRWITRDCSKRLNFACSKETVPV